MAWRVVLKVECDGGCLNAMEAEARNMRAAPKDFFALEDAAIAKGWRRFKGSAPGIFCPTCLKRVSEEE